MIVLAALWLLGVTTSYTMGGLIHVLLVAAVIMLLLKMFRDRRPASG
jgi:multisubunit Na+/H+ antiporter MnhE subunit